MIMFVLSKLELRDSPTMLAVPSRGELPQNMVTDILSQRVHYVTC